MIYDKHIDKTDEELRELNKVYGKSDLSRFLDGLSAGHIDTEEKVIELTNYIRESDGLTQLENIRLPFQFHEEKNSLVKKKSQS